MNSLHFNTFGRTAVRGNWHITRSSAVNRLYFPHSEGAYFVVGGKKTPFVPGNLYILPAALGYRLEKDENSVFDHTFFDFEITPPLSADAFTVLPLEKYPVLEHFCRYFDALFTFFPCRSAEFLPLISSEFENLLFIIEKITPLPRISDERVREALEFIHENYGSHITAKDISQKVCLEKSYFIKLFSRVMKQTPYHYLKCYRLEKALALLRSGASVKETALACGFESTSAFSHCMKKSLGFPPSDKKA